MPIRPAAADDLEVVGRLRLAFLADHRGIDPASFDRRFVEHTRSFIEDRHRAGDLLTWLAVDDRGAVPDPFVGIVSMLTRPVPPRPDDPGTVEAYVINLYVVAEARRRGIGQALLDACLHQARSASYRRLVLHATSDGRPLYERAGFVANDDWLELPMGS